MILLDAKNRQLGGGMSGATEAFEQAADFALSLEQTMSETLRCLNRGKTDPDREGERSRVAFLLDTLNEYAVLARYLSKELREI